MIPTRDHKQIKAWATRHSALPAEVEGTANGTPALLAFFVAGAYRDTRTLREISWRDFFARFDLFELSMAWDATGQFSLVHVEKDPAQKWTH